MSPPSPDLGVVVLDHGLPELTRRAVGSCLAQDPAPRVLVVDNGAAAPADLPEGVECLALEDNRGYAGGMNAGVTRLLGAGVRGVLLLNNDAVLEAGCLARLEQALPGRAAVAPVVIRAADGRVESAGATLNTRTGRFRLLEHGAVFEPRRSGPAAVQLLSGVALLVAREAFERIGPLREEYFHGFEDVEWCLRAGRDGCELAVVRDAVARHEGGATLGREAPDRLYYAVRNHLMVLERHAPLRVAPRLLRQWSVVAAYVGYAARPGGPAVLAGLAAIAAGRRDFAHGRTGKRGGEGA